MCFVAGHVRLFGLRLLEHLQTQTDSGESGEWKIRTPMGQKKVSILVRCPYFRGLLNCMQELLLGKEKVSLLERCPHFRSVLRELPDYRLTCIMVS